MCIYTYIAYFFYVKMLTFSLNVIIPTNAVFTDGRSSRNGTHQSGSASSRESHSLLDNSQSRNISMLPPVLKSASQSGAISHKAPMSEQEFTKTYNSVLKHYLEEPIVEVSSLKFKGSRLYQFILSEMGYYNLPQIALFIIVN